MLYTIGEKCIILGQNQIIQKLQETHNELEDLQRSLAKKLFEQILQSESCTRIFQLFNGYQNVLRTDNGELSCV